MTANSSPSSAHKTPKTLHHKAISPQAPQHKTTQWLTPLLITLFLSPAAVASASVFDPVGKFLSPLYQRLTNQAQTTDPSHLPQHHNRPSDDIAQDATVAQTLTMLAPKDTPTPDLFAVLQAEFAINRHDSKTALALYKSQALKENATAVFERALQLSMELESPLSSLDFAKTWQQQNQDHIPAWFYVTHLALKAEEYPTVAEHLRRILEYDPKADISQIFAGILPRNQAAGQALFWALPDEDDNASLSVLKAGLLAQIGEPKAAILHLNNALKSNPNNLAYLTLKADILRFQDSETNLLTFLQQSLKSTTGDTQKQLYLYQARYFIDNGDLPKAWQGLAVASRLFSDDVELTLLASLVALDIHNYQAANRLLIKLTDHATVASEAYYYLGISHERMQQHATAQTYFSQVQDGQFVMPAAQKRVAYQLSQNNPDNAIAILVDLRNNLELYASESYMLHADILQRLGKKEEAAALLQEAYNKYPDDLSLLYASTKLLDNADHYDQKHKNLSLLLQHDPSHPAYLLDMATLTLSKTPDHAPSLAIAEHISTISFDDPDYDSDRQLSALLLLANHALSQKNYQTVIDYLQTPYDVAPSLPVGITLLRAYQGLGNDTMVSNLLNELTTRFDGRTTDTSGSLGNTTNTDDTTQDY